MCKDTTMGVRVNKAEIKKITQMVNKSKAKGGKPVMKL